MIKEFDIAFIKNEMGKKQKQFLHAVGQHASNIAVGHAPFDKGPLRNSIIYKLVDNTGGAMNTRGGETAPAEAELTRSDNKDYVKVGSNLIYANRREWEGRGSGYMAKTLDEMERSGIMQIAEKVFKW